MLKGRLGLETARVPHSDRHGLLFLSHGKLTVRDGTLCFIAAGSPELLAGSYDIPFQTVSAILLGPGTTISHDTLRLCARHGTGICAVGDEGVRLYTFPPLGTDSSALAREQVRRWSDPEKRLAVIRQMYAWRLGEFLTPVDISVLRGIEGARMKESYKLLAQQHGVAWAGRIYDRSRPNDTDAPNQAINHVVTAIEACAAIACAVTGVIPQLGFIHEDSGQSMVLDLADLYRTEVTLPTAFIAVRESQRRPKETLERISRWMAAKSIRKHDLIPSMIDRLKVLFEAKGPGDPVTSQEP